MQEIELVKGDCSHPPLNDDVSDYYLSNFSDHDMEYEYYHIHLNHEPPIRPMLDEKTIQAIGDLAGDPLHSWKTRSQFHNTFSTCDSNILDKCFMMVQYYHQ